MNYIFVVGAPREDQVAADYQALGCRDDLLTCGEPYHLFAIVADEFTPTFPFALAVRPSADC